MFKFVDLLRKSAVRLKTQPPNYCKVIDFQQGAVWMAHQLGKEIPETSRVTPWYNWMGVLKYGLCLVGAMVLFFGLGIYNLWSYGLTFILFYIIEVHFLFLFPLLIDQVSNPFIQSLRATYRVGLINCLVNVIPIAMWMLVGLLNRKQPYHHWYMGCMAIIIWYEESVRDRLSSK